MQKKGYEIIARNYRNSYGEIDIIARDGDTQVYCEIKYRSGTDFGDPLEAVDKRKQHRISRVALYHYARNGYAENRQCRFDVIAIYGDGRITHIENAFDFQG